jgi:nucleoid-associated protein YgaU/DNA-binding SARP family transcriptional activator
VTRDTAKAAIRLLAGLMLLAAVPIALVLAVGWPLPREIPSLDQLREAFDRRGVPVEVLVKTLAVIMWVAWAQLVVAVMIEAVAAARGRQARRAAVLPGVQLVAGQLVAAGALVLSLLGPLRSADAAAGPLTLEAVQQPATPPPSPIASPPPAPPASTPSSGGGYVVQRGDSYWGLAQQHLGDGARWREIRDANVGRAVDPGRIIGAQDDDLQPGWLIRLPAATVTSTAVSTPAGSDPSAAASSLAARASGEITVTPGDNLWRIAERELAERWGRPPSVDEITSYWHQLVEINRPRLAPPGDPNLIYPGQRFLTPPTGAPTPESSPGPERPEAADAGPRPAPPSPAPAEPPPAPAPTADAPSSTLPRDGHDEPQPDPGARASRSPEKAPPSTTPADGSEGVLGDLVAPLGLAGGGVTLAGLVLLLDRRRRAQQRHRRRGRRIPLPSAAMERGEAELRAGADIDGARLVDVALRAGAVGCGSMGLPALRWVEASPKSVLLVLAAPAEAPHGFRAESPDRWRTTASIEGLAGLAGDAGSPSPTLAPVGTTTDGAEVLVELEASGVATISGPSDVTVNFLRALAVAAATVPWTDQPQVMVVGLGDDLCALPWVSSSPSLADALAAAERRTEQAAEALRSTQWTTTAQARAASEVPDAWDPLVVVSAISPDEVDQPRLGALAARPHHGVAVITPPGPGSPPGRAFVLDEAGHLRIDGVDPAVRARLLNDADARLAADVLDIAARHTDTAPDQSDTDRPRRTPAVAEPTPGQNCLDALLGEVEVMLRVLGEVEAARIDPAGEQRLTPERQKSLEALVYLALRESPVDREDLEITLFPTGANATKTFHNTVSAARRAVGDALFPPATGGRYELSHRVVTDYALFCELVSQADDTDDATQAATLLHEALGLVRGEPFTGVGRNYSWVSSHRGMIVAQVIDAAEQLAEIHLADGDWRAAEWAARQALRAFPCDERMYRLLMRTAAAAGNIPGVERAFCELCTAVADPDDGVEPEDTVHPDTVTLLEELTRPTHRRRVGA